MRFLTGGYTADMSGAASGIGMLQAGTLHDALAGGPLAYLGVVASCDSPSWLAWHPTGGVVYAALEGAGTVQAFVRTGDDRFDPWGQAVPAGELVCHVAVAPDGRSLVASCWGDGRVVWMPLDARGRPGTPVVAAVADDPYGDDVGSGTASGSGAGSGRSVHGGGRGGVDLAAAARALREAAGPEYAHLVPDYGLHGGAPDGMTVGGSAAEGAAPSQEPASRVSRAHQALFISADTVLTTDMGFDAVRVWRCTASGLRPLQQLALPRGVGPRHMLRHPSGYVYVVTELSQELFVLAVDRAGVWRVVSGTRLSPAVRADDAAAEVTASSDGRFVSVGVRGSNAVATLRVRGEGGAVEPVALVDAGVDWPRHHVVARDTLLVAGQRSDDVVSLTLDERSGVPGRVRHRTTAPSPTCLLPLL